MNQGIIGGDPTSAATTAEGSLAPSDHNGQDVPHMVEHPPSSLILACPICRETTKPAAMRPLDQEATPPTAMAPAGAIHVDEYYICPAGHAYQLRWLAA